MNLSSLYLLCSIALMTDVRRSISFCVLTSCFTFRNLGCEQENETTCEHVQNRCSAFARQERGGLGARARIDFTALTAVRAVNLGCEQENETTCEHVQKRCSAFARQERGGLVDGQTLAGWGVISRSPHGRINVMFGPVLTTEAHLAFSGARIRSNNTAEMTVMIEGLSFLGPHGPVTHDEQSCIYYDSLHAAGNCLGIVQARTHVQLALACQQSLVRDQRRLRVTMQHVYGHGGNLGKECAGHAAALGTLGLISNHDVATRWTRRFCMF